MVILQVREMTVGVSRDHTPPRCDATQAPQPRAHLIHFEREEEGRGKAKDASKPERVGTTQRVPNGHIVPVSLVNTPRPQQLFEQIDENGLDALRRGQALRAPPARQLERRHLASAADRLALVSGALLKVSRRGVTGPRHARTANAERAL